MDKQWWVIEANKRFIGRCYATVAEIKAAVGPWRRIEGNAVYVFASPPVER